MLNHRVTPRKDQTHHGQHILWPQMVWIRTGPPWNVAWHRARTERPARIGNDSPGSPDTHADSTNEIRGADAPGTPPGRLPSASETYLRFWHIWCRTFALLGGRPAFLAHLVPHFVETSAFMFWGTLGVPTRVYRRVNECPLGERGGRNTSRQQHEDTFTLNPTVVTLIFFPRTFFPTPDYPFTPGYVGRGYSDY